MLAATRLPVPIRDRLDAIAARKGLTRSALVAQVVTRYVEGYPLGDDD